MATQVLMVHVAHDFATVDVIGMSGWFERRCLICAKTPLDVDAELEETRAVTLPLNAMRCPVCGHRMDSLQGCDDCAADRAEAERQQAEDDDDAG